MKINKLIGKAGAFAVGAVLAANLSAAPSIEVTNVQQQYPWTNVVDIAYTVSGVTNQGYFAAFEARHDGKVIGVISNELDGTGRVAADVQTLTTTWEPPFDLQLKGVTLTPMIYKQNPPQWGLAEYLIVDLATGDVRYEPMTTQTASNNRYNTTAYKTSMMVFRLVKPQDCKIGYTSTQATYGCKPATVHVKYPYYMAIFRTTQAQAAYINGSTSTSILPQNDSYTNIRGVSGIAAAVAANTMSSKLQTKLNAKGNTYMTVDLPTYGMFEVAAMAGASDTPYFWGTGTALSTINTYCYTNSASANVGQKRPNNWGFYDIGGLNYQWVRDGSGNNASGTAAKNSTVWQTIENGRDNVLEPWATTYSTQRTYIRSAWNYNRTGNAYGYTCGRASAAYSSSYNYRLALYPTEHYPSGK